MLVLALKHGESFNKLRQMFIYYWFCIPFWNIQQFTLEYYCLCFGLLAAVPQSKAQLSIHAEKMKKKSPNCKVKKSINNLGPIQLLFTHILNQFIKYVKFGNFSLETNKWTYETNTHECIHQPSTYDDEMMRWWKQ